MAGSIYQIAEKISKLYQEAYDAAFINQGMNQKERRELFRQLARQQIQILETVSLNSLSKLGISSKEN